jgi:hypothetical protein
MIKLAINSLCTALSLPFYLEWAQGRAEQQIDKMQSAVFNTPGAESPLPPVVFLGGMGLLVTHFAFGQVLGLRGWQRFLSLLLGIAIGLGIVYRRKGKFL